MNKNKIIGLLISFIGIATLVLALSIHESSKSEKGLSSLEILLMVSSFILMMGGISFYQNVKDYNKRRKFIKIAFPISLLIILSGVTLKYLELSGGGILSVSGSFFLCFSVIPVIAKNRYVRWKKYTNSKIQIIGLMICDSLGLALILLSVLFYLQRWPGSLIMIISGFILMLMALFLWNKKFESLFSFQSEAKIRLEAQHKEIIDSINYAKRIQSAILPPDKMVNEYLKESFILYKPKDIVAGDFYWMEHTNGKVLFAAADCTGHGVPGAMVSVVCNNALNRSVREHGLTDPGKILDKTREIVIQEFEKSDEEVKDGMDIALCSLEGNKLHYAGAHNPLWIIRNGEIIETKANKQPIGKFDNLVPYTTHGFELEKGDSIYIFSDGYVDQFGGDKGKKFKAKAFRILLLSIQDKPMEEQKVLIDEAFEAWRGSLEQIDDVCVIGVRI